MLAGMVGGLDRLTSVFRRAVTRARGDYRSGHRFNGYAEYLLESGKFPHHIQGPAHIDRILADVQTFAELASGMDAQVILDIGALNGIESRVLAKAFPNARVFTFEPVAESAQEVRWITRDLSNVVVVESAVSDRNGSTSFLSRETVALPAFGVRLMQVQLGGCDSRRFAYPPPRLKPGQANGASRASTSFGWMCKARRT